MVRPLVVDQSSVGVNESFTVRRFLPMLLLQKPHSDVVQYSQTTVSETHLVSYDVL